jgi:hypothetical protein
MQRETEVRDASQRARKKEISPTMLRLAPIHLTPLFAKYAKWLELKCAERNPHSIMFMGRTEL